MKISQAITNSSSSAMVVWYVQQDARFSLTEAAWFAYRLFGGDSATVLGLPESTKLSPEPLPTTLIREWGEICHTSGGISFAPTYAIVPCCLLPYFELRHGSISGRGKKRDWWVWSPPLPLRRMSGDAVMLVTEDEIPRPRRGLVRLSSNFRMVGAEPRWIEAMFREALNGGKWESVALSRSDVPVVVEQDYVFWPLSTSPLVMVAFTPTLVRYEYEYEDEDERMRKGIAEGFEALYDRLCKHSGTVLSSNL